MLKQDTLYRGPHAVHVKRHRKLGRHCTVLKNAVPLINHLLSLPLVKRIHLGPLIGVTERKRWPRQQVSFLVARNGHLRMTFCAGRKLQIITFETPDVEAVKELIAKALET